MLPWNIEVVCLGLPFFAIGHLVVQKWGHLQMQNWVNTHRSISLVLAFVLAVIVMIGSSANGSISFGHAAIHNPLITYSCAFAGIAMLLLICMLLAGTKACLNNARWMQDLKWFGRNSFTAMAIHNPIKGFVCLIVGTVFNCSSAIVSESDSYSLIAFVITLFLTVVGIMIVNLIKTKYKQISPFCK